MNHTAHSSKPAFDANLKRYVGEIHRIPLLEPDEEFALAKRYREQGDRHGAHRLINSHLRLVVKIALNYRGYGLPLGELISEGNVGLMQAVERFDPNKGFRLVTYAVWWIRASIQEYIMRSRSLVTMGTTTNQRRLFFNLRKAKSRISALDDGDMRPDQVKLIAKRTGVAERDVIEMNRRLSGDMSLNAPLQPTESNSWQDLLADEAPSQEHVISERDQIDKGRAVLADALAMLDEREQRIFVSRRLSETPRKLADIANEFRVSPERVRQIEMRAFEKVRKAVTRRMAA
jgi:RNA polymerase sigma-32 factor